MFDVQSIFESALAAQTRLNEEKYADVIKNNVGRNVGDPLLDKNGKEVKDTVLVAKPNTISGVTYIARNGNSVLIVNIDPDSNMNRITMPASTAREMKKFL